MKIVDVEKRKKLIIMAMILCCLLGFEMANVKAEASGAIPVTYTVENSTAFPLTVVVEGDGSISASNEVLKQQTKQYLLAVDESLFFTISPDKGVSLKSVTLNGTNIMSKIHNDTLILDGAHEEQQLIFTFETKASKAPSTKDITSMSLNILLLMLSTGCIYYLHKKRQIEKTTIIRLSGGK